MKELLSALANVKKRSRHVIKDTTNHSLNQSILILIVWEQVEPSWKRTVLLLQPIEDGR
jgi:hypothetical protein